MNDEDKLKMCRKCGTPVVEKLGYAKLIKVINGCKIFTYFCHRCVDNKGDIK